MKLLIPLTISLATKPSVPLFTLNSATQSQFGNAPCESGSFVLIKSQVNEDLWNVYHAKVQGPSITDRDFCDVVYCELSKTGPSVCPDTLKDSVPTDTVIKTSHELALPEDKKPQVDDDDDDDIRDHEAYMGDEIKRMQSLTSRRLVATEKLNQLHSALSLMLAETVTQLRLESIFDNVKALQDDQKVAMATARKGILESNAVLESCTSRMDSLNFEYTQP